MSVIIVLIAVSLTVATGFLIAFLWAVRNGQFEDTYAPSVRILMDEKNKPSSPLNSNSEKEK
ncbi:cbb3-type cytochrome oxidase assembly protein CcoS [bacterium]|nr:cbb3-type cytochrome oxidase assembly protein CcoS [bacterium]